MPIDIARARAETPGTANVLHFNNAGSALMPQPVLDATVNYLNLEAQIGGYEAADRQEAQIERFYAAAAELLNCDPDEIAFIENATRAWDMAFYAIPFQLGDRILTARAEYASNVIAFLQMAEQRGVSVEVIPSEETGELSVSALRDMMDDHVKLIAMIGAFLGPYSGLEAMLWTMVIAGVASVMPVFGPNALAQEVPASSGGTVTVARYQ